MGDGWESLSVLVTNLIPNTFFNWITQASRSVRSNRESRQAFTLEASFRIYATTARARRTIALINICKGITKITTTSFQLFKFSKFLTNTVSPGRSQLEPWIADATEWPNWWIETPPILTPSPTSTLSAFVTFDAKGLILRSCESVQADAFVGSNSIFTASSG